MRSERLSAVPLDPGASRRHRIFGRCSHFRGPGPAPGHWASRSRRRSTRRFNRWGGARISPRPARCSEGRREGRTGRLRRRRRRRRTRETTRIGPTASRRILGKSRSACLYESTRVSGRQLSAGTSPFGPACQNASCRRAACDKSCVGDLTSETAGDGDLTSRKRSRWSCPKNSEPNKFSEAT